MGRQALRLPQHPDEHRPKRPVLLAVDQQLRRTFGSADSSRTRRATGRDRSRGGGGRGGARREQPAARVAATWDGLWS